MARQLLLTRGVDRNTRLCHGLTYEIHVLGVHAAVNQQTDELFHDNLQDKV